MTLEVKTDPARPGYPGSAILRTTAPRQRQPLQPTSPLPPLHRRHEQLRALFPLLLVLAVQAALTLRLADTASENEALARFFGHQGISGLVNGVTGTGELAAYFSNMPFIYPVLAAVGDGHFGLECLLSLLFMLGATTLLWSSTRALFGRSAAIGAVMVFGLAGPTLFLRHYAAYDAPAVLLCAASLRILIATARRRLWTPLLAVPTTVLAIAISHATALYLPLLALVAVLSAATAVPGRDRRWHHLARGVLFTAAVGALIEVWLALFSPGDQQVLETTTTNRLVGSDDFGAIIGDSVQWGIAALVLGLLGTLAVARRRRAYPCDPHSMAPVLLTFALAVSVMLAPAYQLHIHTSQSLEKHIEIGLLFSAAPAGIALSSPLRSAWRARTRYGVVVLTALMLGSVGADQAGKLFDYWPSSTALATVLKQAMGKGGGHYLAEASNLPQSYTADLPDGTRNDWENTYFFRYEDAAGKHVSGLPAYRQAIADHYFKLVVLSRRDTPALDGELDTLLKAHEGYRLIGDIPISDVFGKTDYDVWEAVN